MVAIDPKDFRSQGELAKAYNQLGLGLVKTGKTSGLGYELKALEMYGKFYASDPRDKRNEELLADSYVPLGDTEVLLASRTNIAPSQNQRHWQHARSWYQHALATLLEPRFQGAFRGKEAGQPGRITRAIAQCNSALRECNLRWALKSSN